MELRKQPSTSRMGWHQKAAKGLGEEFITSFSGLEEVSTVLKVLYSICLPCSLTVGQVTKKAQVKTNTVESKMTKPKKVEEKSPFNRLSGFELALRVSSGHRSSSSSSNSSSSSSSLY